MDQKVCVKFESASKLLSRRWIGLIVNQLLDGPKRFKDLEYEINISSKVLADKLKELETHQIIVRQVHPETPVRIEYELTQMGKDLKPVMDAITDWSQKYYK
ncbi:MAG: winged helix-turn-helix transcriptional regulator [Acholeplasmataceae bacterium]